MNKLQIMLCTLVLAPFAPTAYAGSDSGIYLGGSVGVASQSMTIDAVEGEFDDDDTGYKFFAGYNFGLIPTIDLAVEGSYVNFGSSAGEILTEEFSSETTAWDLYGLAGFKLGPVGLFGKVGVVAWDTDVSFSTLEETVTDDGNDLTYGVGAKIQLDSFAVRAEYEYFDFEDIDTDMISVGASITF